MTDKSMSRMHLGLMAVILATLFVYAAADYKYKNASPMLFAQPSDSTRDVVEDKLPGIIKKLKSASPHKGTSTFSRDPALTSGDPVIVSKEVTVTEIKIEPAKKPVIVATPKPVKAKKTVAVKAKSATARKPAKKVARDPVVVFLDDLFGSPTGYKPYKPDNAFWKNL